MNQFCLLEFIESPYRNAPLVGLHYVVEIKAKPSNRLLIKCNLCKVRGNETLMKKHLVSLIHVKMYMEKHYMFLLTGVHKNQLDFMLWEFAKEVERMEGTNGIHIEYVTESEFAKEQESWIPPKYEVFGPDDKPQHCPVYRRKMAILYSRNFKISSREEAAEVLKLTEQLNERLEAYYLKCKEPATVESTVAKDIVTNTDMLPPVSETINIENPSKQGLDSAAQKTPWETPEASTSSMYVYNPFSQPYVPTTTEQNTPVSQSGLSNSCSNIEAAAESLPPVAPDPKAPMAENVANTVVTEESSSLSSSLQGQSSETSSSSSKHTYGKTSKTLSPDILLLLKGKDASTVTNILKTLSPFYPALQDVNLEMLAQVLVNTGALD